MKSLQKNTFTFLIALVILGFSFVSFMDLSDAPITSRVEAVWTLLAILLTLAGLFMSPVLILQALCSMVTDLMQPTLKQKRKRQE
ncbi:MAG: hypothetical protein Q9P01_05855 [Anaerolineae bacterium]|nr:hypothetical protein [Anaerolineae bacterium]MDQ7034361.1 hypothetical protein [Anaerolineae bacterium]